MIRALATLLFVISIPVALVTLNVRYAFNEARLWSYGFDRYRVEEATGLPRSEIDRAASELRDYFNNDEETVRIEVVQGGREVALFNPREVIHLADVKSLVRGVYVLQAATLGFALAYIVAVFIWAREMPVRSLARRVLAGSLLTLALVSAFGVAAMLGFERLFTQFHVLSFSNDFWKLNPATDRLVQMFPFGFWQDATFFVGVLSVGEALLGALIAGLYLRRTAPRAPQPAEEEDYTVESAPVEGYELQ